MPALKGYWIVPLLVVFFSLHTAYASRIDSLLTELNKNPHDTTKIKILFQLIHEDGIKKDEAEEYAWEALNLAENIKYEFGIAISNYGLMYFARSDAEIYRFMNVALEKFNNLGLEHYTAKTYLKASGSFLSNGYLIKAMRQAQLFLTTEYAKIDSISTSTAWNLIGEVYRITGNFSYALEAYHESKKYASSNYISPFINIGTVFMEQANYEEALNCYDSMINSLRSIQDTIRNAYGYLMNRKAEVYLRQSKVLKAEQFALRSLKIYEALNYDMGKVFPLNTLCEIYYSRGQFEKSIEVGVQSVQIAMNQRFYIEGVDRTSKLVAEMFLKKNDLINAHKFEVIRGQIRDKINNPKISAELANEQIKLERQKQDLEKQLFEEKQSRAQEMLNKQKLVNGIAFGAFLLVLIFSILIFRSMKIKHRLNAELIEKQKSIIRQAEELKVFNEKMKQINLNLEAMVDERSEEIKRQNSKLTEYAFFNAHKVRGPLARILGLINLMNRDFPNDPYEDYKQMMLDAGNDLDAAVKEIKAVLEEDDFDAKNIEADQKAIGSKIS